MTVTGAGITEAGNTEAGNTEAGNEERQEYLAGGLHEVRCEACGRPVRAGKRSAMQTSVQWSGQACDRLVAVADGRPTALVPTCPELRASIDRAVREGRLEVS